MEDGGYIHHLVLCKGWLWKRSNKSGGIAGSLQYRKRYFELSNIALTYQQNEKKTDVSVAECGCGEEEVIKCTFLHIHPSHLHSYSLSHYTPSPCDPTSFSFSSFLLLHLPFSFPSPFSLLPPSFPFHLSLPSFLFLSHSSSPYLSFLNRRPRATQFSGSRWWRSWTRVHFTASTCSKWWLSPTSPPRFHTHAHRSHCTFRHL